MSYKIGKKVWILHKKTDGTYNKGKIVGGGNCVVRVKGASL